MIRLGSASDFSRRMSRQRKYRAENTNRDLRRHQAQGLTGLATVFENPTTPNALRERWAGPRASAGPATAVNVYGIPIAGELRELSLGGSRFIEIASKRSWQRIVNVDWPSAKLRFQGIELQLQGYEPTNFVRISTFMASRCIHREVTEWETTACIRREVVCQANPSSKELSPKLGWSPRFRRCSSSPR